MQGAVLQVWSAKPVERRRTPDRVRPLPVQYMYRNLYDLSLDGQVRFAAISLHQFLAADPHVVCKVCYSALNRQWRPPRPAVSA